MSIKLVTIDIDGTLINSQHQLTQRTKVAIQKAKQAGVKIVLSTGRPLPGVTKYLKELALFDVGDYVITYNGSLVQETHSEKIISAHTLTYDNFIEIEAMARKLGSHLHTIDDKYIYTANQHISPYTMHEATLTGMPLYYRPIDSMTSGLTIIKMMMIDEPEILDNVIQRIPAWFKEKYTTAKSADYYYEILNKQASKGAALQELADYLHLKKEETMAIGDNENDLSMLEVAGTSVGMGNAVDSVKNVVDFVTLSNDEDGVAHAIEAYAL